MLRNWLFWDINEFIEIFNKSLIIYENLSFINNLNRKFNFKKFINNLNRNLILNKFINNLTRNLISPLKTQFL